jgi:leader peptidase (prepilin peptidase)/N-methyltransferase
MTFLLGLVLASFLNALMYRIDNGYKYPDIFIKGSHCEKCGKLLKTYELIPVLSYVIFRGRCPICKYKIPLYYPISELMLGIGMASIYYYSLSPILYIVLLFFFSFSYYDRIYKGVPQKLVNTFLGFSIIYFVSITLLHSQIPQNALIAGIVVIIFIIVISKILKKPFGMGDFLVLLGLSIFLDIKLYVGYIYIFLILSTLFAVSRIMLKKSTLKTPIPLLPFMFISLSLLFLLNEYVIEFVERTFYL